MNVAELLNKLRVIADIEIVVPLLPEVRGIANQSPRHTLLQRLDGHSERCSLWLADQQVNMLWHDYIAVHAKPEAASDTFERGLEGARRRLRGERRRAMVAAEGDKVSLAGLVKALQSPGHETV